MTIREIVISAGYVVDSQSAKTVEKSITSIKNFATKALGAIGIGFSFVKLNALVEEYALIQQKIKNATAGLKDQADAQDEVQKAADSARASYADMTNTVTGLLNSHNRLFKSVKDTTEFAELMHKAFRAAGLSSSDTASLASSLTSAFSTGKVSASQFSSLMQKTPQIVTYLAQTLGITEQQVKALGSAGKITSTQLYQSLRQNADAINNSFGTVQMTVTDALTSIKSQFSAWLYQLNDTYKITDKVARLMLNVFTRVKSFLERCIANVESLGKKLGGVENLLKLIVVGIASISAAISSVKLFAKMAQGTTVIQKLAEALGTAGGAAAGAGGIFKSFGSALGTVAKAAGSALPWILLIIAVIAALLIAVEDLVNFFNGKDSVVGGLFEKMGLSATDMKEKISNVVNSIKSVLGDLIKVVVQILGLAAQIIGGGLAAAINLIVSLLEKIMPMLERIMSTIMPIIQKLIVSLSTVINKVLGSVMEVVATVIDLLTTLLDLIMPIIDLLMTLLDLVLTPIMDILDIVLGIIGDIVAVLVKLLNSILRPVVNILKGVVSALKPVFDLLTKLLNSVLGPIMDVIMAILEPLWAIIDVLIVLLDSILEPINEILNILAEVLTGVLGEAISFVVKLLQPLLDLFGALLKIVSKVISYITSAVSTFTSKVGSAITSLIKGPLEGIITVLKNIVGFISGVFSGDWSKAWKSLGNIPIAIINGIISGFESLLNFFVNAINAITGALSSLWTWIGIPAIPEIPKVSFGRIAYLAKGGYVDKDSPTPVVIGDNKQEGEIVSPISKMKETMLDALATFMNSRNSTARAAGVLTQETTNRSIVQNININNDFKCGSTDVGRTARDAMRQSTRDTTAELAHALAYAR